ncbi:aminoglycoside phosphotransferase family protein [Actinokineospora sp. PR83]|uniref:aminoglycoside phosphotransferase family protein n=1 Tax=Actinokineospora sp. PR83 TaxID=2884908 RepID=UPI001F2552B8|nr:aminoglycoside phosphotransferase family protein [Actinokineospora sp. PR83]MCG8920780.1 aminoglycoside phosphotransferase family protein [Actinokineospora sp. PR83]
MTVEIDVALVRRLLAAQCPQWSDLPVVPVAKPGWDNMTFRVGDRLSIRLPRYPRWEEQVTREQRWLPVLAPHLPLAVPTPVFRGEPGEGYPFPWSVIEWLDGEDAVGFTPTEESVLALAGFFRALRAIDATGGPPPQWSNGFRGGPVDDERDSPIVADRLRAKLDALAGLTDVDGLTAVWETGLAAPAWPHPPVWVHGDPAPGNLLVRDGRLVAVIDFGTVAVGDPACDLIAAWASVPARHRAAYRDALGVDDATWARGRVWGMTATLPTPEDFATDPAGAHRRVAELVDDAQADATA